MQGRTPHRWVSVLAYKTSVGCLFYIGMTAPLRILPILSRNITHYKYDDETVSNEGLDSIKPMLYGLYEKNLLKCVCGHKSAKGESYNEKFSPERTNCSFA